MVLLYRRRLLSSLAKYRSNKLGRNHVTKSRCSLFIYPAHTLLQSISTQRLSASSCSAGSKRVTDWSLRKRTTTPHVMSAAAPPLSRHRHTHIHTHQLSSCPQVDNWGFNFMLGWPSPPPTSPLTLHHCHSLRLQGCVYVCVSAGMGLFVCLSVFLFACICVQMYVCIGLHINYSVRLHGYVFFSVSAHVFASPFGRMLACVCLLVCVPFFTERMCSNYLLESVCVGERGELICV